MVVFKGISVFNHPLLEKKNCIRIVLSILLWTYSIKKTPPLPVKIYTAMEHARVNIESVVLLYIL